MNKRTTIALSRQAFNYNCAMLKHAAGESNVAVVVKSNAYGHGMLSIAQLVQENDLVSWLCTAGTGEALTLRKHGITKNIIALSYIDELESSHLEQTIQSHIHIGLHTYEDACALNAAAERVGKKAFVHIKIDSGMSRLGILPEDALTFIRALSHLPFLVIEGIFTHLCDTPNPNQTFSYQQLEVFDEVLATIEAAGIHIPYTHALSSSALSLKPKRTYSFIRSGAMTYGIWKSESHKALVKTHHPTLELMPVLEWKTRIIGLRKLSAGSTVGYNRTFTAEKPTLIAIAPVGYEDGYPRCLSNKGVALINNQTAPVAGIVSMNLTAFDATHINDVKLNDEIILVGHQSPVTATECAQAGGVIANEIITNLNPSLERTIVEAHKHYSIPYEMPVVKTMIKTV